ncbi:MAG: Mut7-C RNAse domain-containing protein [Candidatus Micrarchaeota archaeon]
MVKRVFVADAMLGKLVRWLRLLGEKVFYIQESDELTLKKAIREKAVLLTRDENLAAKAKDYAKVVLFKTNDSFEQLKALMKQFKLKARDSPSFTLCPHCGGKIRKVAKKKAEGKVFPRVYRMQKVFWQCKDCGQFYWKGSHWTKITKKLLRMKR